MPRTAAAFCLFFLPVGWIGPTIAGDLPTDAEQEKLRGEVARLLGELDSDRFEVRRGAAERLEELVARPELGRLLSAEFHRVLLRSGVSFEVRWHLTRWSRRLPKVAPQPAAVASPDELDRLVRQLDDDSYAVRLGATRRLEWLLNNPKLVYPVMIRLKRRMADPKIPAETKHRREAIWHRARGAWLLTDPADWDLPAVSEQKLNGWIDELVRPASAVAGQVAARELLDLLARDEYVPRVNKALESRLAGNLDPETAGRLKKLLELTRPAMVAEFWYGRRHATEQHLLIGVPSLGPGAARPSHFDRIDDKTTHCVSGNTLTPGDYPVGVAFPVGQREGAFFHLVNLPTPRRRMAYTHYVKTDEATRLAALSRRTLDRMLAEKRKLTELELVMLSTLDAEEVSRFAGKHFNLVEDERLPPSGRRRTGGRPSRLGMICAQLATDGTKEAVPGLLEAIEKKRFLAPNSLAPYRLHWLAALSIAIRDPWPKVDAWLAGLIDRKEILMERRPNGPELGATAAGVLLKRRGKKLPGFGLQSVAEPQLLRFRIDGYRFVSDEARKKLRNWWEREAADVGGDAAGGR